MLHDSHQLDSVVTGCLDMFQSDVSEFLVSAHTALFLGHTDVGFVDVQFFFTFKTGIGPVESDAVVNDLSLKRVVGLVLNSPAAVQRQMLGTGHIGIHNGLDLTAVPQGIVTFQINFPVAVTNSCQRMGCLVPIIKFTFQIQRISVGGPLTVIPASLDMMETVVVMCIGEVIQRLVTGKNTVLSSMIQVHAQINVACEAL